MSRGGDAGGTGHPAIRVSLPEGTAFPGEQLWRLFTDFVTGSAGIACFLEELRKCLNGIMPSALLQPDGLLEEYVTTKDH